MPILKKIFSPLVDFVFPISPRALPYHNISIDMLVSKLPGAKPLTDRNMLAVFDYQDNRVREMIWQIKYKGNDEIISKVSEILYETLCAEIAERALFENFKNPILIPIPSSIKRIQEKGFSQTELICKKIYELDENNLFRLELNLLTKTRYTESQTKTVTRKERFENLRNSMEVKDKLKLHKSCVVLIDDVITTGATVIEARRALNECGVRKVLSLAIAH